MLNILLFFAYVFLIKAEPQLNDVQKLFLTLVNDIRTAPQSFSKYLEEEFLPAFSSKVFNNTLETNEGVAAFKELSKRLKTLEIRFPLHLNPFLCSIAEKHSQFMLTNESLTHYENGQTPLGILKKKGNFIGKTAQSVLKVKKNLGSLITVLVFMVVDDGIVERGNQVALLDERFEEIGVGVEENQNDFYLTIIYAEEFRPNSDFENEMINYKAKDGEFTILRDDAEKVNSLIGNSEFQFQFQKKKESVNENNNKEQSSKVNQTEEKIIKTDNQKKEETNEKQIDTEKVETIEKISKDNKTENKIENNDQKIQEQSNEIKSNQENSEKELEDKTTKNTQIKEIEQNDQKKEININQDENVKKETGLAKDSNKIKSKKKKEKISQIQTKSSDKSEESEEFSELSNEDKNQDQQNSSKILAIKELYQNLDKLTKSVSTLNNQFKKYKWKQISSIQSYQPKDQKSNL